MMTERQQVESSTAWRPPQRMSGGRRLTGGKAVREAAGLMQIAAGGDWQVSDRNELVEVLRCQTVKYAVGHQRDLACINQHVLTLSKKNMPIAFSDVPGRPALRTASRGDFIVPRTNRQFGDRAFCVAAPRLWNRLPCS